MDMKVLTRITDMMTPIKCKNNEPYTTRALAGDFTWFVYNKRSGYIVAATYDQKMAETILSGIKQQGFYQDEYSITEMWKTPEPMV
jgi:hypothetical protein